MAEKISIGDAVLTFMGDTTNLEAAYDRVNSEAKTKLGPARDESQKLGDSFKKSGQEGQEAGIQVSEAWMKMARATAENTAAQKQLQDALLAVKVTGGQDVVAMLALAQAQQRAAIASMELAAAQKEAGTSIEQAGFRMDKAKGSFAVGGELIGVTIPRHIRSFLAELPGVGAAMEAAFSGFAILMLIQILAEGVAKLVEMHEAAEKLREEWTMQETDFRHTSQGIQDQIDKQQEKFIELTEGPVAAYDFALKHLRSTAEETLSKITGEVDSAAQKFEARGGMLAYIFGGQDSSRAGEMGGLLKEFNADLQETIHKAEDANKQDPFAGYNAGLAKVSQKIKEIQAQITEATATNNAGKGRFADGKGIAADDALDVKSLERTVTVLQHIQDQLGKGKELQSATDKTNDEQRKVQAIQREVEIGTARIDVQKGFMTAVLALQQEENNRRLAEGKESYDQFIAVEREAADKRYSLEKSALEQRIVLLEKDPTKNAAAIISANGKLRELEFQHKLDILKIDEDGYKHQADAAIRAMDVIIATTRLGSQARVDDEQKKLDIIKGKFGEESDAYKEQQVKVNEAAKAVTEEQLKLNQEQRHSEEALADDKMAANLRFYQWLLQTARISAAELLKLQQTEVENAYQRKRTALEAQLKELGPDEVVARKKVNDAIELLDQQHQETLRQNGQQTEDILELQYQALGLKSGDMWGREAKRAKEAFDAIKASGKATYTELLHAQIKVLEATIAWNTALGKNSTKEVNELKKLNNALHAIELTSGKLNKNIKLSETLLKTLGVDAQLMGSKVQNVALATTGALEQMFMAWAQGGVTVAQAAEQIAAAVLKSLAQYAFAKATEQLALGFAAMSPTSPDFGHSGEHFGSAALWFAAGAAASIAGGLMSNATSHSSSSSSSASASTSTSGQGGAGEDQPEQPPVNTVNVQHLAAGALVSRRTHAIIGDSMSGGDATEGVIPLDHPAALKRIGQAIGDHMGNGGGDIHVHVKGMISSDNLGKVVKQISQKVKKNRLNLTASNSFRVTKRSK